MARIAMVNTVLTGSHGRIMRDLRDAARQRGHEVLLACGRGPAGDGEALRIGTRRDVLAHVALTRALDRHALGSRRATQAFLRALDSFAPDLVHLHNVHGYYLHAPLLFAYLEAKRLPVVWTHHDCWALTGHCSHFVRAGCDRWMTGCHHCPLKRAYPASWGLDGSRGNWRWKREAFTAPVALRIASPSAWLDGVLAQSYLRGIPRQIIPNGVDLSLFSPASDSAAEDRRAVRTRYGVPDGQRLLLAVAAPFDGRKGLPDLLRLAALAEGKARVMLVGLSPKQVQRLPQNVIGIERTDGPEALVSLYRAADCLVNPTYEDTYPTVNMEAIACGTPVAGYAVGGAAEQLMPPAGTGVPVGDVPGLLEAAMALAARKAEGAQAIRAFALESFDRGAAALAYMQLYETMLGDN